MSLKRVLVWSTLGTIGWTTALALGGYLLGTRYDVIEGYVGPVSNGIVIALVLWYFYRVATWKPRT